MAYAHVQSKVAFGADAKRSSGVTSIAETFTSTPTVGNILFCYITWTSATDVLTTVTDNQSGNSWTVIKTFNGTRSLGCAIAWCIPTASSGTFTVTANFSSSATCCIGLSEYSGNAAASPQDGTAVSAAGTGTSYAAGSITPSQTGDLHLSVISDQDSNQTYTQPTSWTKRVENANGNTGFVISAAAFINAGSSAQAATWTATSSTDWLALHAAFKEAGGSGGPTADQLAGIFAQQKSGGVIGRVDA